MQACGITGSVWQWLLSCLTNRLQFVKISATKSDLRNVEYGVPQLSLVGPRIFSIYVHDFSESISQGELHLYADNITAFVIGDSTDEVVRKVNLLFPETCRWCNLNKLTLQSDDLGPYFRPMRKHCNWIHIFKSLGVALLTDCFAKIKYIKYANHMIITFVCLRECGIYHPTFGRDIFQDYVTFSFICVGKLFYCWIFRNWRTVSKSGQNDS